MIRAAIIYFSGTGNTKFVACNMKKKLEEKNIYTDLINIKDYKNKSNIAYGPLIN